MRPPCFERFVQWSAKEKPVKDSHLGEKLFIVAVLTCSVVFVVTTIYLK